MESTLGGARFAGSILLSLLLVMTGCRQTEETPKPAGKPAAEKPAAAALPQIPLGLPPLAIPANNPMTPEKVELGKLLYFDTRLSKGNDISCATCHDPKMAWAEHLPTSKGHKGQIGKRNSPTVINAAYLPVQFWDGRVATLEEQASGPIENPAEMGSSMVDAIQTVAANSEYQRRFKEVFGNGVTKENIVQAIAAFERTILSGNAPYDRYQNGAQDALTDVQKRGMEIFMDRGQCATCHTPPIFTNGRYYNAGVGMNADDPDKGRMDVTGKEIDRGKFRAPALREAANTAPYFHDGSVATLKEAVHLMAVGGIDNPNLSAVLKAVRDANLNEQDIDDLVAFLNALSGEYPTMEPPTLPQ